MHAISLLTLVQLALVLVGVVFQIVALSWLYRDSSGERSDGEHDGWGNKTINLGNRQRPVKRTHAHHSARDYYEIEKTPPGVRPADLRKTARVTYMDQTNVPGAQP